MIEKCIDKLTFFKKLDVKNAKNIFQMIIFLDQIFLRIRLFILKFFSMKNKKASQAIRDLENNGVAIIKNFYNEERINEINENCLDLLNKIPIKITYNKEYIQAKEFQIGDKKLYLEKLGKSVKIKGLNLISNLTKLISDNSFFNALIFTYHLNKNKPYIIYNVSHDGSETHPVLKDYSAQNNQNEAIAGKPHTDLFIHKLRCFVALKDVDQNNGATIYYDKSHKSKLLKKTHMNLFLNKFDFDSDPNNTDYISNEILQELEKNYQKKHLVCNKGDLVLIDLKMAHYAVMPKKGSRHLLWLYY